MRRLSLTQWIVLCAIFGTVLGIAAPEFAQHLAPLSTIFLRLIKSLVVPLIFGTLVVGIAGHGDDMKRVGRLAFRSIVYFEVVTTGALAVGLLVANLARPGDGVRLATASAEAGAELAHKTATFKDILEHTVPQSVVEAAMHNDVLQVVVWTVIFAVALSRVQGTPKLTMLGFCESLSQVMFKFTEVVMAYAPIGIGAALAVTVSQNGMGVLISLGKLVVTLYGALAVFLLVVLLPVAFFARVPIIRFIKAVRQPALIAFTTSSSEAALPLAVKRMEEIGVPPRIVGFVIPTGYSFNLDGSTLYLAVTSVFAAQAAGISMSLSQQLLMMLTLMLTSKGVAGVPRASLVILSGALATFGLPLQAVAVILGVDAFMDMARTTVNVVGNCLASVVVARWEGEYETVEAAA